MPCYDSRTTDPKCVCKDIQERLNMATRVACEAIAFLEDKDYLEALSSEATVWWHFHKQDDKKRKARK